MIALRADCLSINACVDGPTAGAGLAAGARMDGAVSATAAVVAGVAGIGGGVRTDADGVVGRAAFLTGSHFSNLSAAALRLCTPLDTGLVIVFRSRLTSSTPLSLAACSMALLNSRPI